MHCIRPTLTPSRTGRHTIAFFQVELQAINVPRRVHRWSEQAICRKPAPAVTTVLRMRLALDGLATAYS